MRADPHPTDPPGDPPSADPPADPLPTDPPGDPAAGGASVVPDVAAEGLPVDPPGDPPPADPPADPPDPTVHPSVLARLERLDDAIGKANEQAERAQRYADAQATIARRNMLRRAGGIHALSDEQLLDLAPEVDPSTVEGRAALDRFVAENPGLFPRDNTPRQLNPTEFAATDAAKNAAAFFGGVEAASQAYGRWMGSGE